MSHTPLSRAGAAAALLCLAPSSSVAASSLKAVGVAAAAAYRDSHQGNSVLMPGPGSLQVVVGATASDAVANPSPPPLDLAMDALVSGNGIARYGSLAGRAHAEAKSLPANSLLAGGQVTLDLGFSDEALVLSDTLDDGTPVTLTFVMTLEGSAVHFTDPSVANPESTGAAARHEVEVSDPDNVLQPPGKGALVINSRGVVEGLQTFEFDTAIGRRLKLVANLQVSAGVDIDFTLNGFSQGSADVIADQTAELFYQPSGDVRVVGDSGHDYLAPEPGQALLLVAGTLLLLRRTRRRRPRG